MQPFSTHRAPGVTMFPLEWDENAQCLEHRIARGITGFLNTPLLERRLIMGFHLLLEGSKVEMAPALKKTAKLIFIHRVSHILWTNSDELASPQWRAPLLLLKCTDGPCVISRDSLGAGKTPMRANQMTSCFFFPPMRTFALA